MLLLLFTRIDVSVRHRPDTPGHTGGSAQREPHAEPVSQSYLTALEPVGKSV